MSSSRKDVPSQSTCSDDSYSEISLRCSGSNRFSQLNLQDPNIVLYRCDVATGFLRSFCDKEYNAENISFIQEVNHWKADYKMLRKRGIESLGKSVLDIWNKFCSDSTDTQICIDSDNNLAYKHKIGEIEEAIKKNDVTYKIRKDFFNPLLKNSQDAIMVDIFPRFVRSSLFKELEERMHLTKETPEKLNRTAKLYAVHSQNSGKPTGVQKPLEEFNLNDFIENDLVFGKLKEFCEKTHCQEAPVCRRKIFEYQETFNKNDNLITQRDAAFAIFDTFVSPNSELEIPTDKTSRQKVAYQLAHPRKDTFDCLVKNLNTIMESDHLPNFKRSPMYTELVKLVEEQYGQKNAKSSSFCVMM